VAHSDEATELGQRHRPAIHQTRHHRHLWPRDAMFRGFRQWTAEQIAPERADVDQRLLRLLRDSSTGWKRADSCAAVLT
jgi:hypothetical protein